MKAWKPEQLADRVFTVVMIGIAAEIGVMFLILANW